MTPRSRDPSPWAILLRQGFEGQVNGFCVVVGDRVSEERLDDAIAAVR